MKFDLWRSVEVFVIGLIVCFTTTMLLGDEAFTGIAIIYLAAVIAGKVSNK
ncbi:hypothetical protein H8S10_10120 [Clostridium sp. NSJ-49]|uniref:Uncharacterized protein n=1 Tax=Clostridium disporicum TaxID=84024 RepID=A0A174IDJ9_9CLOT|nr:MULTISPECIES: hypothetical protein [Clostridium]MBC5625807.1 hypothetical protein [Clostridium sp. NSJ-49]MCD2500920.1 hypothetical protein [Clostridium sp. NSJ-145]MDU6341232.1 hypothetical protein [Clostridium sp.]CUO84246.1 Uncharacterised protein [Clostridium disporicum]